MGCKKNKPSKKPPTPGMYRCADCGSVRKKKSKLCNPEKIKSHA